MRHISNKPVYKLSGDQFVRISAAERADYVTVKLGMLEVPKRLFPSLLLLMTLNCKPTVLCKR